MSVKVVSDTQVMALVRPCDGCGFALEFMLEDARYRFFQPPEQGRRNADCTDYDSYRTGLYVRCPRDECHTTTWIGADRADAVLKCAVRAHLSEKDTRKKR